MKRLDGLARMDARAKRDILLIGHSQTILIINSFILLLNTQHGHELLNLCLKNSLLYTLIGL